MGETASTAAALLIGNELLSGKIADANLRELAKTLRAVGVELRRVVMLPDEIQLIAAEVRALSASHDVVFTSGGVGPTHDDVTIDAVSKAFDVEPVPHPDVLAMFEKAYGDRLTDGHRRMALVPNGAQLVLSADMRWPTIVMRNVWVLPGVPEAFRMKLTQVRERVRGTSAFSSREVFTKMDEAELKPILDQVVGEHPGVEVGSYPKWFDASYKTKVTFDARDAAAVDAALDRFVALLPDGEPQRVI